MKFSTTSPPMQPSQPFGGSCAVVAIVRLVRDIRINSAFLINLIHFTFFLSSWTVREPKFKVREITVLDCNRWRNWCNC